MENKKRFIINICYYALIAGLVYLTVKYLLPVVFPFIVGFLFAYFAMKLTRKVFKKDAKIYRIISLLCIYISIILVITIMINSGLNRLTAFIASMPTMYKQIVEPAISSLQKEVLTFYNSLPIDVVKSLTSSIESIFAALRKLLSNGVSILASGATSIITYAPSFFVSLIITIVSSFYFLFDYEGIYDWIKNAFPKKVEDVLRDIRDFCEETLFKIVLSYVVIMLLTFVELFIGLLILKIPNAGLWSFLIAFLDILPVLGVGTVLIPWGITSIVIGNVGLGIGILVLYLVITIIRNVIEPKMVGGNLGLHPLATLIAMIVGVNFFGIIGMFGFPLALSFILLRKKKTEILD